MTDSTHAGIYAAIDMGSNSTELLVARCAPNALEPLMDESAMTLLGASVKENGIISPDKRDAAMKVVHQYVDLARQQQANPILLVATEAMREAKNNQEIVEQIQRETSVPVSIINGQQEATLTYYGASYDDHIDPDAAVLDVGGGSVELIMARHKRISWLTSLPLGSGWLHDQYLHSNPPATDEVRQVQNLLRQYFAQLHVPEFPRQLLVTGSSAKNILKIARHALGLDAQCTRLTLEDLLGCQGLLCSLSAEEIARRFEQKLERARVLPGGALIIHAMMEYLNVHEIQVTDHGVREGVLLAYARYGDHWMDHEEVRLEDERWQQPPPLPQHQQEQPAHPQENYLQAGRSELPKRVDKFVEWHDEVLKNEDIEAVHKMRVASRRLRATMDAYEAASKPKPYKKAYRKIKAAADLLGAARDTDVMISNLQQQLEHIPSTEQAGVRWLINHLTTYRQQRQQALTAFLQNFDEQAFAHLVTSSLVKGASNRGKS